MYPVKTPKTFAWIKQAAPELAGWLSETSTYLTAEAVCEVFESGETVCVNLYSDKNIYHIQCRPGGRSYLGLTFSTRSTGAGNDLSDGACERGTWDKIIRDILSCELISLKRVADPSHKD